MSEERKGSGVTTWLGLGLGLGFGFGFGLGLGLGLGLGAEGWRSDHPAQLARPR